MRRGTQTKLQRTDAERSGLVHMGLSVQLLSKKRRHAHIQTGTTNPGRRVHGRMTHTAKRRRLLYERALVLLWRLLCASVTDRGLVLQQLLLVKVLWVLAVEHQVRRLFLLLLLLLSLLAQHALMMQR